MYTALEHYIDGNWVKPTGAKKQDVINPANSKAIGELGHVSRGDLDKALAAVDKGFKTWRKVSALRGGGDDITLIYRRHRQRVYIGYSRYGAG